MKPYKKYSVEDIKRNQSDDYSIKFYSEEITVKTRFGEYKVEDEVFNSTSYNELLSKVIKSVASTLSRKVNYESKSFPFLQVNNYELATVLDNYIRNRLFNSNFNPMIDNNWKVLLNYEAGVISHIMRELLKIILAIKEKYLSNKQVVEKRYFSEVKTIKIREKYSIEVSKAIYKRLPYPTNKGGFEKVFMEYCDTESKVDAFIKIKENVHSFAYFSYIREDGNISRYYPDFLVKVDGAIFVVETKAQKDIDNKNVQYKKRAVECALDKINKLNDEDR